MVAGPNKWRRMMPRAFQINGESLVVVTGPAGSAIAVPTQLGLSSDAVRVTMYEVSEEVHVDAYGKGNPVDEQVFGGWARIEMNMVHFSQLTLAECVRLAFPGALVEGSLGSAGRLRGNQVPVGNAFSSFITLNIASPRESLPYNFLTAWLAEQPYMMPLGTERSIARLIWKANAYSVDPWNGGAGSLGAVLYNRVAAGASVNL